MFPLPNKIIGTRSELLKSYINQIKDLETREFPYKKKNIFRFCSYNIKFFNFENYTSNDVKKFIDKVKPDAYSLIEYDVKYDINFKYNKKSTEQILFEQLPNYGILTVYNKASIDAKNYSFNTLNKLGTLNNIRYGKSKELRGFTHMSIKYNDIIINIITIHLNVCDESGNTRLQEITDLYNYITINNLSCVLIVGDFNEWNLKKTDKTYNDSLIDFKQRTGLKNFSTKVHDFLKLHNFVNAFHMKDKHPKFSCWSGKLVDFCYLFKDSWDNSIEIFDIHMPFIPFSDHLPIIIDIGVAN